MVPLVEVHLSNVDDREDWRRALGDSRASRPPPHRGQGPGGLPRGARGARPRRAGVRARIDRLRERLERPLLVTNLTNVRVSLTGLGELEHRAAGRGRRAGAALHRLPLPRAGPGESTVSRSCGPRRDVLGDLPDPSWTGRSPSRPGHLTYARLGAPAGGGRRAGACARGVVEALRDDQGARGDRGDPPGGVRYLGPRVRSGSPASRSWAAPSATSCGGWRELIHEGGADGAAFSTAVGCRAHGRLSARAAGRPPHRGGG